MRLMAIARGNRAVPAMIPFRYPAATNGTQISKMEWVGGFVRNRMRGNRKRPNAVTVIRNVAAYLLRDACCPECRAGGQRAAGPRYRSAYGQADKHYTPEI